MAQLRFQILHRAGKQILWLFFIAMFLVQDRQLGAQTVSKPATQEQGTSELTGVRGIVIDAGTGAPLKNVVVWIQDTEKTTVTDETGHFEIEGFGTWRHVLCLSAVNYTFVRREITVVTGSLEELEIPMFGGAATYSETVTVVATLHGETEIVPTSQALRGSALQSLSSGVIEDPVQGGTIAPRSRDGR